MPRIQPHCTEPSHQPVIEFSEERSLYFRVSEAISSHSRAGTPQGEIERLVSGELLPGLVNPWAGDAYRVQQMRGKIARDWMNVFNKVDNLSYLAGWFINDCIREGSATELHYVIGLFAFEAIRNAFAIVNQLRSALPNDTFGYLRTLHEASVKSRFLEKFSGVDPDLAARLWCWTDTAYFNFYQSLAPVDDPHKADNMWAVAQHQYDSRFRSSGKGDYPWAYPLVKKRAATPN